MTDDTEALPIVFVPEEGSVSLVGLDVVYHCGRLDYPGGQTAYTERMGSEVGCSGSLPLGAVPSLATATSSLVVPTRGSLRTVLAEGARHGYRLYLGTLERRGSSVRSGSVTMPSLSRSVVKEVVVAQSTARLLPVG